MRRLPRKAPDAQPLVRVITAVQLGMRDASVRGGLLVRRDDDGPDLFLSAREALKSGVVIHAGDRIEFSVAPGAAAVDVMLCAYSGERHRI